MNVLIEIILVLIIIGVGVFLIPSLCYRLGRNIRERDKRRKRK